MTGPERVEPRFTGRYVRVDEERWPGFESYEVVRLPSAAAIVAITPGGDVLLVKQFRPPVADTLLEIPAGLLDIEGEDAMTCAVRELREETGHLARSTEFLGGVFVAPGATDQYVHLFMAEASAEPVQAPEPGIEVVRRPWPDVVAAAGAGKIRDAKTALGVLLAARRLPPG